MTEVCARTVLCSVLLGPLVTFMVLQVCRLVHVQAMLWTQGTNQILLILDIYLVPY
jgi:hypothetical protein